MTPEERAKLETELNVLRREFNVLLFEDREPAVSNRLEDLRIRIANARAVLATDGGETAT